MPFDFLLAAIAVIIIIGLAFYAGLLISRIKTHSQKNNQQQLQRQAEAQIKRQQRNAHICKSIRLIACATAQKQCNVSEAAIRLTILLETLLMDKPIDTENEYPALSELFHKVKAMPTHEQRKKVPIKALKKLDMQRQVFEAELEDRIIAEAEQLQNFSVV